MKSTILTTLLFFITFTAVSQIVGTAYKLDSIEIAQFDLPDEVTWYNAKRECKELGKGWRLPTKGELEKIYDKWFNPGPTNINMPISSDLKKAFEIQALPH